MKAGALERDLRAWFAETAAPQAPEFEEDIIIETAGMSQRPRWTYLPLLPRPMGGSIRLALAPRRTQIVLLLAALALVLASAAAWVGSRPRLPAPFGAAADGLVAYGKGDDIFVVDPATGERRAIALGPSIDRFPRWSLDGTRIAFLRGGVLAQLVVTDADGTVVSTTHGETLASIDQDGIEWSPDGRHVALIGNGGIYLVEVETGDTSRLPARDSLGISIHWRPPDGRELTFLTSTDGRPSIVSMDIENGQVTPVPLADDARLGEDLGLRPIGWTPDGRRFAYHRTGPGALGYETRVVDVETGDEVILGVALGRISNDGTRIVGLDSDGTRDWLCVAPTTGGLCQPIQGEPRLVDPTGFASFQWAPDDRSIRTDPGDEPGVGWLLDPGGGPVQQPEWAAEGAESWQRRAP
jgi:dipeptidyl aminopeptidase/acylaminoacyl peptidase